MENASARNQPYDQAARETLRPALLAAEMPVAWVYHSRGVQGVTARLSGVRMDLRGEMPTIASWRLDAGHAAR